MLDKKTGKPFLTTNIRRKRRASFIIFFTNHQGGCSVFIRNNSWINIPIGHSSNAIYKQLMVKNQECAPQLLWDNLSFHSLFCSGLAIIQVATAAGHPGWFQSKCLPKCLQATRFWDRFLRYLMVVSHFHQSSQVLLLTLSFSVLHVKQTSPRLVSRSGTIVRHKHYTRCMQDWLVGFLFVSAQRQKMSFVLL